jgi:GvpD gas vesicle protein
MTIPARPETGGRKWDPIVDPEGRYSSGVPDLDRLLGGGFGRGSCALFQLDGATSTEALDLTFTPLMLNFLYHSRGIIAVLPSRDSPHSFRERLTRYATRRRFDTRVRVVDYIGEDDEAPYTVNLRASLRSPEKTTAKDRNAQMQKMVEAEKAAQGGHRRTFLEFNAVEVGEMLFGAAVSTRMCFHGIKRARAVGNLIVVLTRPGLQNADAVRGMADTQFELRQEPMGTTIRGVRPAFGPHLIATDRARGPPHVALVPGPTPAGAIGDVPALAAATSSGRTRRR